MLSLFTEWNDAPGVRDPVLAATWARLEIKDESSSDFKWPSQVIRSTANSWDRGVYLSLFPLAEWIVENWWFLLNESCRVPEFNSGRSLASYHPAQRAWIQRHNLLAAREGGALPDLTIYRDGDAVVQKWAPDPDQDDATRPVRFIGQGTLYADPLEVERTLHQFVEAVLQRVVSNADDSAERLRANWTAICQSRHEESSLCCWSASLGSPNPRAANRGLTMPRISELGLRDAVSFSSRPTAASSGPWVTLRRRLDSVLPRPAAHSRGPDLPGGPPHHCP